MFKKDLGAGDRGRLDTYLENIREIERRIKIAMEQIGEGADSEIPFGLPESKHVHYRLMYDLMALAFEGDITRSATFMLGRDLSGTSFPESGFNGGWHGSSHHGDKPDNVANYAKINRYHVQNLAYFCDKLQNIPDGDGTRARSRADLQGQQHGQLAPARAREGAGDPGRRYRRHVQGEPPHRVPGQHAADVEHAAEHPAPVRHRAGFEDRPTAAAGLRVAPASGEPPDRSAKGDAETMDAA